MIDQIHNLENCWYLSPPWGKTLPKVVVSLLQEVYVPSTKSFGYCCGIEWEQNNWNYTIACKNKIIYKSGSEIIGTSSLQGVTSSKPVFELGDLVEFQLPFNGPKLRQILGIELINGCWFYTIELRSPQMSESLTSQRALVTSCDLLSVRACLS